MRTIVKILPSLNKTPPNKLADAELHFHGGDLDGLKLIGFAIWERRDRPGREVTFPSRRFTVGGRHRHYLLLRPSEDLRHQDRVRELILSAYAAHHAAIVSASGPNECNPTEPS